MNGMPPRMPKKQTDGIEKPENLLGLPAYIFKKIKGFCTRLFYILSLVFEASPALLVAMVVLCIIEGLLPVFGAYVSKELLNSVAELIGSAASGDLYVDIFETLSPLIILFVSYFIYLFLKKIFSRSNTMITSIAGELVSNHIKLKIIEKAKESDLSAFDRPEFYEKLENANREAGMRPIQILRSSLGVISSMISAVSFVVVLATLSPWAPLIIILAATPAAIVNYIYRNKSFLYMRRHSKERRKMQYYSSMMVNREMAKEVKLLGLGDDFTERYKSVFAKYYAGIKRLVMKESASQIIVGLISTLANCLLFFVVAYKVIYADGEIGDYSLYTGALTSISGYVSTLLTSTASIYEGTLFINNMIEFESERPEIVPSISAPLLPNRGSYHTLEFKNVSFSYPGSQKKVLENINITMTSDDSVVLVGLNGAGKTTFIKLLTRLYDPTEGVILLDGRDIREYDVRALYNMFGIVFQDFGKYSESAAENIEFGDICRDHERQEVVYAAECGGADDFIKKLPAGYDTPLTRIFEEDGIELSGGQWQKLSVSRAFYKDSDILILDEPTASLDALAEKEVFDRFERLSSGKLTVFVSHKLSSATSASKIVVLDEGKIAEVGDHETLMKNRGRYYTLYTTQSERYARASEKQI